jgi:hypothetical protein
MLPEAATGTGRDNAEKMHRFRVFPSNFRRVRKFHERDHSYKLAVEKFGDMTDEEVSAAYWCEELPDDGGPGRTRTRVGSPCPRATANTSIRITSTIPARCNGSLNDKLLL